MPLYRTNENSFNNAMQAMKASAATAATMQKQTKYEPPKKSFGGALLSGVAGGAMGLGTANWFDENASQALYKETFGKWFGDGATNAGGTNVIENLTGNALGETFNTATTSTPFIVPEIPTGIAQGIGGTGVAGADTFTSGLGAVTKGLSTGAGASALSSGAGAVETAGSLLPGASALANGALAGTNLGGMGSTLAAANGALDATAGLTTGAELAGAGASAAGVAGTTAGTAAMSAPATMGLSLLAAGVLAGLGSYFF